jgi:hypothetical protein
MRLIARVWFVSSSLLLLAGCASSAVKVGTRPPDTYSDGEVVRGDACGVLLWGIIPAGSNSRTERAYAAALGGRGTGLVDTKLQYSWYAIPFVGYLLCTNVEGRVVQ